MALLKKGGAGTRLDAIVETVAIVEADPRDDSVGYGGLPNADGEVELDCSIMDGPTLWRGRGRRAQAHHAPIARRASRHGAHRPRLHRRRRRIEVRPRARLQGRGSADGGIAREVAAMEGADERHRRLGPAGQGRGAGLRCAAEEIGATRADPRRPVALARDRSREGVGDDQLPGARCNWRPVRDYDHERPGVQDPGAHR